MYLIHEGPTVPPAALERAIDGFLRGVFADEPKADLRQERIRRASFYEAYGRLCLSAAYPDGCPPHPENEQLTEALIRRAADGVYNFRKHLEARYSWVAVECRWMLESYMGRPVSTGISSWGWNKGLSIDSRAIETADLAILEEYLQNSRRALCEGLSTYTPDSSAKANAADAKRQSLLRRKK